MRYRFSKLSVVLCLLITTIYTVKAQQIIHLYKKIPNSKPNKNYIERKFIDSYGSHSYAKTTNPFVEVYYPAKENNKHIAMILIPGGGYSMLAYDWEGPGIGSYLVKWGITVVTLKYRLPSDSIMVDKFIGPLQDAQRAIQLTRANAKKWDIDPDKIGVMGFSAGGHLASMTSVYFNEPVIDNPDNVSLRPDFAVLMYPVISGDSAIVNWGSRKAMLGEHPTVDMVNKFSTELHVTANTPPTFIALTADDKTVKPENSIRYFQALQKYKIPSELHIYQNGGHGFMIWHHDENDEWVQNLKYWLVQNSFLK